MTDYERNADASKTLSDKWKKGELPEGWYWIKGSRAEGIYAYTAEYLNHMYSPKNSDRIIEPVPSFEQWQEYKNANDSMFDTIKMLNKDNGELEKENTKLKELLKECREQLEVLAEKYDILDCIALVEKCPSCGEQTEVKMTAFKGCNFKVGLYWECPKCHKDFYIEDVKLGVK